MMSKVLSVAAFCALFALAACSTARRNETGDHLSASVIETPSPLAPIVYLHRAYTAEGNRYIAIDVADALLTGDAATAALQEDDPHCAAAPGQECNPPQGWYLRNRTSSISLFGVSEKAEVTFGPLSLPLTGTEKIVTFEQLGSLLEAPNQRLTTIPFQLTIEDGNVQAIREFIVP